MTIRRLLKIYFENFTGLKIFKILPIGIEPLYDVKRKLKDENFNVLFDVGANIGQSTKSFLKYFPHAKIYSFEPGLDSFKKLELLAKKNPNIHCFNIALSNENGKLRFFVDKNNPTSTMNSVVKEEKLATKNHYEIQDIEAQTLDFFCKKNNINHINYLKIDTEGNDFSVLKGAENLMENFSVDLIQVEVGMNPTNTFHNPFCELKQYLEERMYYLFGIYDQNHEWFQKKPILRRCDALFVSKNIYSKKQM
jgi:FkbM family methyltransferase